VVKSVCSACINTSRLVNSYDKTVRADSVWNAGPAYLQGQGIGVAVVDSGVANNNDLKTASGTGWRIVAQAKFNSNTNSMGDGYGHGTHVAGIIGGNGAVSNGTYIGIAPKVNIINVKVSDDQGASLASDVVNGLQWIYTNKTTYNIKVVNLSVNSSAYQSYNVDPIDAAAEILWFNKIVVVASAGNNGTSTLYPPANDPFVITVGAVDDRGTNNVSDDVVATYSAYGTTLEGFAKPDLVAPGSNIVSLSAGPSSSLAIQHPTNVVNNNYFRMSGTSMAAPVVAGAAALLLQDEPGLTPDQVKYRLKTTAQRSWGGYTSLKAGSGILDIYGAVNGTSTSSSNTGIAASRLLWTGSQPITWGTANWNSANWNSVNWSSVNWNSINWNLVNWNSDYWGP
jgi:serine protease AprX